MTLTCPPVIYLFSFLHRGTAFFMVIVQFCGCLVQQYRACVVDSLELGIITCVISLYYVYKASQSCLLCHPYNYSNLTNFYSYLSHLIFKKWVNFIPREGI